MITAARVGKKPLTNVILIMILRSHWQTSSKKDFRSGIRDSHTVN